MTGSDDLALLFRYFNEVHIVAQLSGNAFEKAMPVGMTLPQFAVLNHLARLGGNRTPLEIARAMQVTKGTMTNTLGHLERGGFISVAPDAKDGRSKRVDITEAGRAVRQACIASMAPELGALRTAFAADGFAAALPLLEGVRRFFDERR
ncbi:MAG: MarR family winged helix-turn-helix transcriptional regulator [Rhizobiaceae bacterium]